MVKGGLGSGKNIALKNYDKNALFITPFNKLSIENKKSCINSITIHKLLGLSIVENEDIKIDYVYLI